MEFLPLPGGYRVSMRPIVDGGFIALDHVDTWFPPEIVRRIAECHGFHGPAKWWRATRTRRISSAS
jgi:hypothetical protein